MCLMLKAQTVVIEVSSSLGFLANLQDPSFPESINSSALKSAVACGDDLVCVNGQGSNVL